MKKYESQYDQVALDRLPVIVRIDGRAFHSYTKYCTRPFDRCLHSLMKDTTIALVEEFVAVVGYTQSDEISLVFWQKGDDSQLPFGGRINKINSVMASFATKAFSESLMGCPYEALRGLPVFDARTFIVPSQDEACNYLLWRCLDAAKNSVSMAAQAKFSHKQLHGKTTSQRQEMLFQEFGINWNDYPPEQKRGSWIRREQYVGPSNIAFLNGNPVPIRNRVTVIENMPRFDEVQNKKDFIFNNALPLIGLEDATS